MHESKIICGKETELWRDLVQYGVKLSGKALLEELEHYLVTVFETTFQYKEEQKSFLDGSVAMMLSDAQGQEYFVKWDTLRFVGNTCILRAGFSRFVPRTFGRMCSNPSQYYMAMGATTFMTLSAEYENFKQRQQEEKYRLVARNVPSLIEVLSKLENNEKVVEHLHRVTVGNVTYL